VSNGYSPSEVESPLPRGGVRLRFFVEKIDERHKDDTAGWFTGCRWLLIFGEGNEARGFRTVAEFKAYCRERWGVTRWSRDRLTPDWTPEDGASWKSREGQLWPGTTEPAQ
jgi:hypothetical protein